MDASDASTTRRIPDVGQPTATTYTYYAACNITTSGDDDCIGAARDVTLGGYVEPFAFGSSTTAATSAKVGLVREGDEYSLSGLAMAELPFSAALASGISSMAASSVFAEPSCPAPLNPEWLLLEKSLMSYATFPVQAPPADDDDDADAAATTTPMVFGDGGNVENLGFFQLLQRGVSNIVVFDNTEAVLANASVWDPWTTPPDLTVHTIDEFLASWFGIQMRGCEVGDVDGVVNAEQDTSRNQVFQNVDNVAFATLASALQKGLDGDGAVATVQLQTVDNRWMNVKGGRNVSLTVVYLATPAAWESRLPPSIRRRVHRGQEAGAKPWAEFENFPHYSTLGQLRLSSAEANLLAELTTWVVLQHAEEITAALSGHRDQ